MLSGITCYQSIINQSSSFVGRKEGGINSSSSYYLFSFGQDGVCEAVPVSNW